MTDATAHPILILFAHPALQKSRVNRELVRAVRELEGVTVHDLYEHYPDLHIDVPREQELLLAHEIIIFQHPLFWYSSPAILKEWQDLVLEHGWAYGHGGGALRGKTLLSAVSTGGPEAAYRAEGSNHFTIRQLLAPFEQTANLCGMTFLPPFVVHGTHLKPKAEIAAHAEDYRRTLVALRDGRLDLDAASVHPRLNSDLNALIAS